MGVMVYGDASSGNCYKVQLLLEFLGQEYDWIPIDILKGETGSPEFLMMSPIGKIPVLRLENGEFLAESNAILNYLATGSDWLPDDRVERARVLQWQFFEQYSHEPYIAVARFIQRYLGLPENRRQEYEQKQAGGHKALTIMEEHLARREFLVGDRPSIADISLYAYTHVADEGGFDLTKYRQIRAWIQRIESLPGYVPMQKDGG